MITYCMHSFCAKINYVVFLFILFLNVTTLCSAILELNTIINVFIFVLCIIGESRREQMNQCIC